MLAWQVWLERTYSLSAVLVTGAGLRRLTIYTPGRPQTPTPSRTSVVLWLFGRRAEPSHNPKGTSFKTRLFPALHVPSLESLGHMPSDVITAQHWSGTAYCCGFLASPLHSTPLSSLWVFFFFRSPPSPSSLSSPPWLPSSSFSSSSSLTRGSTAAFPGSLGDRRSDSPMSQGRLQWGQRLLPPMPPRHMGEQHLSAGFFLSPLHSFTPTIPTSPPLYLPVSL